MDIALFGSVSLGQYMAKRVRPPMQDLGEDFGARYGVSCQHERLVGRLIIEWSRLEAIMQEVIWTILDIKWEDGRAITQAMDATRKLQLLRSFSKRHLEGKRLENLTAILDCIELYQEDRNVVAHSTWGTLIETGEPIAMSLRRKSQPDQVVTEGFPAPRMYSIIEGIKDCRDYLILWRETHESSHERRTPPLYGGS